MRSQDTTKQSLSFPPVHFRKQKKSTAGHPSCGGTRSCHSREALVDAQFPQCVAIQATANRKVPVLLKTHERSLRAIAEAAIDAAVIVAQLLQPDLCPHLRALPEWSAAGAWSRRRAVIIIVPIAVVFTIFHPVFENDVRQRRRAWKIVPGSSLKQAAGKSEGTDRESEFGFHTLCETQPAGNYSKEFRRKFAE